MYDHATTTAYAAAGLGQRVPRGRRPALIVVDLMRGFTEPEFDTGADLSSVVEATNTLTAAARPKSVPVVWTAIAYTKAEIQSSAYAWFYKSAGLASLVEGSTAVDLDPRLDVGQNDVQVVKKGASAFFGTNLAANLVAFGVDTVVVCGTSTSGCVRATAVDAMQSGFNVLVPRECVGDRAAGPHEASLFDIDEKYGDVVDLDDARAYLASPPERHDG
ncbi:isochorismatase family protein [Streptomyces sp. NPDC001393]